MATITITLTDSPDDKVTVNFKFDPKLDDTSAACELATIALCAIADAHTEDDEA